MAAGAAACSSTTGCRHSFVTGSSPPPPVREDADEVGRCRKRTPAGGRDDDVDFIQDRLTTAEIIGLLPRSGSATRHQSNATQESIMTRFAATQLRKPLLTSIALLTLTLGSG